MSSKSKSSLPGIPGNKATPATPKAAISKVNKTPSKLSADSPSPQNLRASVERSPRTVTSRSSIIGRPSPRVATPPEKSQSRILKPSELQAQLIAAQDELKKANEKLVLVEKEKAEALSELEEARKLANDANEKLQESIIAQKQAEESSEVEKFWAADLEQDGIESVGKKEEEEWLKELQEVRNQHAIDMASLFSTSGEELQRVKQELAMVTDTKNQALIHADEATKIAEIHAEKVEILSAELVRLKTESTENSDMMELKLELDSLKQELEIAKGFEKNLAQKEQSCELMKSELSSVKEELERANGLEKILAQKEEYCEQMKLGYESIKQELEKAKGLEENLCQKEESVEQMNLEIESLKQELENAKSSGEESYEQFKSESDFLKNELEKAKSLEENLIEKDESLQQLKLELESLKQELVKAKGFEEKLSQREESYEQLKLESDFLKHEFEKAKGFEEKLVHKDESLQRLKSEIEFLKQELEKAIFQREESYEELNIELEASKIAEAYAHNLLEEWKNKIEESSRLENSLESVMKQLEKNGDLLHEAECEINSHKEKVFLLETSLGRQKVDLEESEQNLEKACEEASAAAKEIVSLKSELETVKEENARDLENKKLAESSAKELLEEKKKLIKEIEDLREEDEKSKKAMETLASALHEVSAEAREVKEKLSSQSEHEGLENQIEDLRVKLKATNEKYESLLDDAKCETNHLTSTMDQSKLEFENQMEDMRSVVKESKKKYQSLLIDTNHEIAQLKDNIEHLKMDCQNSKSDENYGTMIDDAKDEIKHLSNMMEKSKVQYEHSKLEWEKKQLQLMNAVKRSEEQKSSMEKEIMRLVNLLREKEEVARSEIEEGSQLREALDKVKAEETTLKTNLHDRESQLQNLIRENEELSKLLEEATAKKQTMENGDFSDCEKDYDMLSEENGHRIEKEASFSKTVTDESKEKGEDGIADLEPKMWESCKIDEREFSMERGEQESVDDELDSKAEAGEGFDQVYGIQSDSNRTSPSKEQQQKKKKKPLYHKFGNLLKKGMSNQK